MLRVLSHVNSVFNSVSYVVLNDVTNECVIIDVGDYADIKDLLDGYDLKGVLLTHTHYDHIYGLRDLIVEHPSVCIYTNEFGSHSLYNPWDNLSLYHDDEIVLPSDLNILIVMDGTFLNILGVDVHIMETPGHDKSCVSYKIHDWLFTGDSYIPGIDVFTKFQNGNLDDAKLSVEKLKKTRNTTIMSGHYLG